MDNLSVISPVASACGNRFVGVARPARFVRGPSRSCAVLERGLPCSSVVSSISVTVDLLCDAHDAHSAMAQEKCPCHHSTIHFITHGCGAWLVVLIRTA